MKQLSYWFCVLSILFLCASSIHGQRLDSLLQVLNEVSDDSLRYALRNKAGWDLYNQNYFEDGKTLALLNLAEIDDDTYANLSRSALLQLAYFDAALGEVKTFKENWALAYEHYEAVKDTTLMTDLLNLRAGEYAKELRYDSAYVLYQKALTFATAKNDLYAISWVNNDIAIIFAEQGLIDKAREYFRYAALAGMVIPDTGTVFIGYNNIARCYIEVNELDSAAYYLEAALTWREKDQSPSFFAAYFDNRARLAFAEENYSEALKYHHRAAKLQAPNPEPLIETLAQIGKVHVKLNQHDSALYYLDQAAIRSRAAEFQMVLRDVLPLQAESHAALGNWREAYENSNAALELRDEYLDEEVQRQVAEMEAKYQLSSLEKIALVQEEKVRQRTTYAIIGFLGLIVISLLSVLVIKRNQQYEELNRSLETQVANRTRELADANDKLREYLKDLQMFTHITSHDLKEPLRNISGFSSLLGRRLKDTLNEDTHTFLEMIKTNAVQMHRLIEGIQSYAAMDPQRKGDVPLEPVNLQEMMEQMISALAGAIDEAGAEVNYASDLPTIQAVPYVLSVVLKNLVENGIKYNRSTPPRVEVTYDKTETEHRITVADNGIGIAPEYHEQIFIMFQRLHGRQDFSGTGMGLGISRKLVRRFDGDIVLESAEGAGSRFAIILPLAE